MLPFGAPIKLKSVEVVLTRRDGRKGPAGVSLAFTPRSASTQ